MAKDPVCGKEADVEIFNEQTEYKGRTCYFCSKDSKSRIEDNPGENKIKVIIKAERAIH